MVYDLARKVTVLEGGSMRTKGVGTWSGMARLGHKSLMWVRRNERTFRLPSIQLEDEPCSSVAR